MMMTKQHGMSMIMVLLLTMASSVIVFAGLNHILTQTRMSGNFQKKINAQLQAEQAIFNTYHQLNAAVTENPTITSETLMALVDEQTHDSGDGRSHKIQVQNFNQSDGLLTLNSTGYRYHDSEMAQLARLKILGSAGNAAKPFAHAILGCEGVDLSGSGSITSYDSQDSSNAATNVSVLTVKPGGSVTLTGASPIQGDVESRGNVTLKGSASISGRVHANGDVFLENASAVIHREVWAGGNITVSNTLTVKGELRANKNVIITNGAKLHDGIKTLGNLSVSGGVNVQGGSLIKGNIQILQWVANGPYFQNKAQTFYGGTTQFNFGVFSNSINITPVKLLPEDGSVDENNETRKLCDPMDIQSHFKAMPTFAALKPLKVNTAWNKRRYLLSEEKGAYLDSPDPSSTTSSENIVFAGKSHKVYSFSSLTMGPDAVLIIRGDVTLYVAEGMTMTDNAQLVIEPNSTLTVLTAGKVRIGNGSRILTSENGQTSPNGLVRGQPVFSIYSVYQSTSSGDFGIDLSGANSGLYVAAYAPYTHVQVTGSNTFSGALIGKTVRVSGAGQIKYDQALATVAGSGSVNSGTKKRVVFGGFSHKSY